MDDINSARDRSIRNIPVPPNHRHVGAPHEEPFDEMPPIPRRNQNNSTGRRFLWMALGVIVVCGAGGVLLSTVFERAHITAFPKTQQVTPPETIEAALVAPQGGIAYQTMTVLQSATTTATANGTQHVSRQATGVVTIYNIYSTASQRLIANTRFEASDGKIYRIHDSITVPGDTKKADGTVVPGSVTATVAADSPGPDYNRTDTTQFTIPGFKNDPRFTKFYAQSSGPIGGGLVGDVPAVAPAQLATAENTLRQQLDSAIRTTAVSSIPPGFLGVVGSVVVSYSDIATTQGSGNTVSLSQTATAAQAIVSRNDLAVAIAKLGVPNYSGQPVTFKDLSQITATLNPPATKNVTGPITLALAGTPTLVWQFDSDAVRQALLGKDKSAFESIMKTFEPEINSAAASISPFWEGTFPSNPAKINIEVKS